MNNQRFLFLDDRNIDFSDNVILKLGRVDKHTKNPLMIEDQSWEQRYDNFYGNIIYDQTEKLFKCWYSPFIVANSSSGMSYDDRQNIEYEGHENQEMGICYATSKDGFCWDKPDLNLVDFDDNKSNNIIFRGPHGAGIFYDEQVATDDARYKLIFQGLKTSYSSDGLIWSQPTYLESVKASGDEKITGDTHNNFLWAPTLSKYVAFTRTWAETDRVVTGPESFLNHKWTRQVSRIESADFKKWSNSTVCITCTNWEQQPYAMPVFFHAGIYLGLLAMHDQVTDRVWTELTWSKDTIVWERIEEGTPFIECSDKKFDYDYGCVYACANPVFFDDHIRIYYGGSDWLHTSWRNGCLAVAMLRPDGFAGLKPKANNLPATIVTPLLTLKEKTILLTADVDPGGWIEAKLIDESKKCSFSERITESSTDHVLFDNESLTTQKGYMEIRFQYATLYSYCLKQK